MMDGHHSMEARDSQELRNRLDVVQQMRGSLRTETAALPSTSKAAERGEGPQRSALEENIALLWAKESQNGRHLRNRYPSKRPRRNQDCDAYFLQVEISAQRRMGSKGPRELGPLAHYASLGLVRKPLARRYHEERARLSALALMPFDEDNSHHVRIFEDVHRLYTGKDARMAGDGRDRWKELGFGGNESDKAFKSGGILTLWMMLQLFKKNRHLAMKIFTDSQSKENRFPFADLCDRATGWVLLAVKKGKLNTIVDDLQLSDSDTASAPRHLFLEAAKRLFIGFVYKFHYYMRETEGRETEGLETAQKKTELYLKRDLSILLKIAEVPDILYLNEDLFIRGNLLKRLKDVFRATCACVKSDRFSDYEDLEHG